MRVLILNWLDRGNPAAGGAEIHLHETFGRLMERGHQVTVVSSGWSDGSSQETLDGIEVHRVGSRLTYGIRAPGYARRWLADRGADLIVEDLNKAPVFTPLWAKRPVLLLVHHLFGRTAFQEASLPVALPTWFLEKPLPKIYRSVPVVAVSESTRSDLVERGFSPDHISVVPNGIDLESFEPVEPGRRFSEPTALYLGRLKKYKRVDLVMRATERIRKDYGVPLRLLVAGKGDHGDALKEEARRLGLLGRGIHFEGFVSEDRKRELLARAWVHCLASPKEGWGISNLEAAASGTPSVASDSPGLRDSVIHGETGFLVPHGDVQALAGRMVQLVRDPELRDRLGRGGRSFASRFSWDRTADRMEEIMSEVVASDQGEM